ncbi:MAG: class I SAM-dependent methyltransferase [Acidobacteriota bacterium]|nr:class I SAM-dependent methyltransferase [Acidobacteriota bacterium]
MNPAEFDNIAAAEKQFWWYRGMRQILFAMLDGYVAPRHIRRALEAGCGTGYFARLVEQRYELPVFPVDLGWEGLDHGRRMGIQRLAQCDVAALPFADESFDLALSMDVIVHFPKGAEEPALREMARVLAPGGLLAIRVSALDVLRSLHSEFAGEKQRFTRKRLLAAVEASGLKTLRCTYANSLLLPVALAKFRVWEPLRRTLPQSGVEPVAAWLDRLLHVPLAMEARLIARGWRLPVGQSLILIAEK